jgi:hypothetical protein
VPAEDERGIWRGVHVDLIKDEEDGLQRMREASGEKFMWT